jgi:phage tail-like protein
MGFKTSQVSTLLDSLPAVFQEDRPAGAPNFLGRFLLGFEAVLLGSGEPQHRGLEETIARIYTYFEPGATLGEGERTPPEFLPWLAGWVALTLREDWDEPRQRDLIAKAALLYRLRGTKRGVEEFLRIYTGNFTARGVSVDELGTAWQLGVRSTVGTDTWIDGGAPFFFRVHVAVSSPQDMKAQRAIAQAIVELRKPAHTSYAPIIIDAPIFQVGERATVGVDTLVG